MSKAAQRIKAYLKKQIETADDEGVIIKPRDLPYKDEHKISTKDSRESSENRIPNTTDINVDFINQHPFLKKVFFSKKPIIEKGLAGVVMNTLRVKCEFEFDFPFYNLIPLASSRPKNVNLAYRMKSAGFDTLKDTNIFPEFTRDVLDEISMTLQGRKLTEQEYKKLIRSFKMVKKLNTEPQVLVGPKKWVNSDKKLDTLQRALNIKTTKY